MRKRATLRQDRDRVIDRGVGYDVHEVKGTGRAGGMRSSWSVSARQKAPKERGSGHDTSTDPASTDATYT